jgi:diphthamide biosynthesis protein 3
MGAYYDEIEIEDMTWDEVKNVYHYPCPCGDRFEISKAQLANYEDIATCPSCSLIIRVVYDPVSIYIISPPDASFIVPRPSSLITKTIPRTAEATLSFKTSVTSTILQFVTALESKNIAPRKQPDYPWTGRLVLIRVDTYHSPEFLITFIENEFLTAVYVQTPIKVPLGVIRPR